MYISNRSKGRLDVLFRIAKKAQKTTQNKLQNNLMGSDIQSLVLSTEISSRIDCYKGQTPPEEMQGQSSVNRAIALVTNQFQITHLQSQPLTM